MNVFTQPRDSIPATVGLMTGCGQSTKPGVNFVVALEDSSTQIASPVTDRSRELCGADRGQPSPLASGSDSCRQRQRSGTKVFG